jgi:hypothetical protein
MAIAVCMASSMYRFNKKIAAILVSSIMFVAIMTTAALAFLPAPAAAQNASSTASANTTAAYDASYKQNAPTIARPVTIELKHHLYHPGDRVQVQGSILMDIVSRVDQLDVVRVELKDSAGNVIARQNATVDKSSGAYSGSLLLLDNAGKGTYTAESRVALEADALGIVSAITSATLQSSMQFAVAQPQEFHVNAGAQNFTVTVASNSAINDFQFRQSDKRVSFFVEGSDGTTGVTEITIPKALLSGHMSVFMDQSLVNDGDVIVKSETEAATTFEINYHHSIHRMEVAGTNVVPEFPMASVAAIAGAIGIIVAISRSKLSIFRRGG